MPLLKDAYTPGFLYKNALFNSVLSSVLRKTEEPILEEIEHETKDDDFFVSHWKKNGCSKLVILLPGLMGNYNSNYNRGFLPKIVAKKYDCCILNARSTTKPNKKAAAFHAAFYTDLIQLLAEIEKEKAYHSVYLIGFSMGGSIALNYLCREANHISSLLKKAAIISAPLLIAPGATLLAKSKNKPYMAYMYRKIRKAAQQKKDILLKEGFDYEAIQKATTFKQIDTLFTAKAFGFKNAEAYWAFASVKPHLKKLKTPTLLINALDDPMLEKNSFPFEFAQKNENLFFEATKYGGHMGFNCKGGLYFENRILDFFGEVKEN